LDAGCLRAVITGNHEPNRLTVTPLSHDVFVWVVDDPAFPYFGTFDVRRRGGVVIELRLNTFRTRNLMFTRVDRPE
jgi:hypothetical protein